ncbi:bacillithiol system redox-active protein YtxJ [Brevibacillus daliensis]|uniref:bacillithiol system redox-active protein YtxJ n=1 Tax=Brevibacillus daliensis TaxID=2892995 RepID=UPI001E4F0EEC|nr:bacillithiol system redox-active protein YtxJ [Brevibacillus daliensis]
MLNLESVDDLNAFLAHPGKRLLLKHSTICPISTTALEQVETYLADSDVATAIVLVREARPVSNEVAERFQIKHESPQIFLFEDGAVKWHTSHWKITKDTLVEAVSN